MQRRQFFAAVAAASGGLLTGCLGYTIKSEEEIQSKNDRIEELRTTIREQESELSSLNETIQQKEDRINQLEETINEKESQISDLEGTVTDQQSEIEQLESEVETLKREKISELYAIGHAHFESGNQAFDSARSSDSNGDYLIAEGNYAIAHGHYLSAEQAFRRAATLAGDVGLTNVQGSIETATNALDDYGLAALNYANEMLFRSQGNSSTADDFESDADSAYGSAQNTPVPTPDEIDSALDL